ncbi:dihydrofolate reductase [Rurimicrobium arvi]
MIITMVVAASENNVIGVHNELPWHLPDDLKFFKQNTLGKPVVMGRKTFESLGRPLPKRLNIVLSRQQPQLPEGVLHFTGSSEALQFLESQGAEEICIIGGGIVFSELLEIADQVFLTRVHAHLEHGEAFFPALPPDSWHKVWEEYHPKDEKHVYDFTFQHFKRSRL